jgi:hypothetical protein
MKTIGTREEVYNDLAKKTSGGLTKKDILKKKKKYISLKKSNEMKKKNPFKKKLTKRKISFELNENETKEFYCKTFNEKKKIINDDEDDDDDDDENKINDNIDFLKLNSLKNENENKKFIIKDIEEIENIELIY